MLAPWRTPAPHLPACMRNVAVSHSCLHCIAMSGACVSPRCALANELLRPRFSFSRLAWQFRGRGPLNWRTAARPVVPRPAAPASATSGSAAPTEEVPRLDAALDDELSRRPLELDPAGYFIIYVDREWGELVAEHYTNVINKQGLACDPVTGEAIPCMPGYRRPPSATWRGRTAKALAVAILEAPRRAGAAPPVARLEHAAYLGRELQRAEAALLGGLAYVQD